MGSAFPLGVFTRGRRDWSIEQMMIASNANAGLSGTPLWSLNNNTKGGNYLAVYGVLGYRAGTQKLMAATVGPGNSRNPPATATTQPIIQGLPALEGFLGLDNSFSSATNSAGLLFIADGIHWLTMGDLPLFVVAPGSQLVVQNAQIHGNSPEGEPQAITFLWGYYSISKPPQLSAFVSSVIATPAVAET